MMQTFPVQTFLADHDTDAGMVAYDRPSPKMLSFLSKHYGRIAVLPTLAPLYAGPPSPERTFANGCNWFGEMISEPDSLGSYSLASPMLAEVVSIPAWTRSLCGKKEWFFCRTESAHVAGQPFCYFPSPSVGSSTGL